MPINPATLTTETAGRDGRTRLTRIATAHPEVFVYVTTTHRSRPSYAGAPTNAYTTSMNLVTVETDGGIRVENFAPADALPVLTTIGVSRYAARGIDVHHAQALAVVVAMSEPTGRTPLGASAAQVRAGRAALSTWLNGRAA